MGAPWAAKSVFSRKSKNFTVFAIPDARIARFAKLGISEGTRGAVQRSADRGEVLGVAHDRIPGEHPWGPQRGCGRVPKSAIWECLQKTVQIEPPRADFGAGFRGEDGGQQCAARLKRKEMSVRRAGNAVGVVSGRSTWRKQRFYRFWACGFQRR